MARNRTKENIRNIIVSRAKKDQCLFCYCDYEGAPAKDRHYYCLIWNSLTRSGQGYVPSYNAKHKCVKADQQACPIFGSLIGYMLNIFTGVMHIMYQSDK